MSNAPVFTRDDPVFVRDPPAMVFTRDKAPVLADPPGAHPGAVLPVASDDQGKLITTPGGWPQLYWPEMIRAPVRGMQIDPLAFNMYDPQQTSDLGAAAALLGGFSRSPAAGGNALATMGREPAPPLRIEPRMTLADIGREPASAPPAEPVRALAAPEAPAAAPKAAPPAEAPRQPAAIAPPPPMKLIRDETPVAPAIPMPPPEAVPAPAPAEIVPPVAAEPPVAAKPRAARTPRPVDPFVTIPKEPQRLIDFLRQNTVQFPGTPHENVIPGGLRDPGGDLKAIIGGSKGRPGLINNAAGSSHNAALMRAWEAGYFPEYPPSGAAPTDESILLDRIREDHAGMPVYSIHDQDAVDAYHYAIAHNSEIEQLSDQHDIPWRGKTHAQFFDALHERRAQDEQAAEWASMPDEHAAAYQEFKTAAKAWVAKDWNPDEFHGKDQARSLEDLENEYRQENAASTAQQRDGGSPKPGTAGPHSRAGEEGGGQVGGAAGVAGRGGASEGKDLLGRPARAPVAPTAPAPHFTKDPNQMGLPGTGPSAVQAQAARDQSGRGGLAAKVDQQKANEGLFAPKEPEQPPLFPGKLVRD